MRFAPALGRYGGARARYSPPPPTNDYPAIPPLSRHPSTPAWRDARSGSACRNRARNRRSASRVVHVTLTSSYGTPISRILAPMPIPTIPLRHRSPVTSHTARSCVIVIPAAYGIAHPALASPADWAREARAGEASMCRSQYGGKGCEGAKRGEKGTNWQEGRRRGMTYADTPQLGCARGVPPRVARCGQMRACAARRAWERCTCGLRRWTRRPRRGRARAGECATLCLVSR